MSTPISISCPYSINKVNENTTRVIAIEVIALSLLALLTNNFFITLVLEMDFAIRAYSNGNASPLKFIAKRISSLFPFEEKLANAAPKKFAASVGFFFSIAILAFQLLELQTAAYITGALLISCAFLEGVFGICVACIIYPYTPLIRR